MCYTNQRKVESEMSYVLVLITLVSTPILALLCLINAIKHRKNNKILVAFIVSLAILVVSFCAIPTSSSKNSSSSINSVSELASTEQKNENESVPEGQPEPKEETVNKETTIEPRVLVEQDGIKITATGYKEDAIDTSNVIWTSSNATLGGNALELLIENGSDKNVDVVCDSLIVNNYMVTAQYNSDVLAGNESTEPIYLFYSDLERAEIYEVQKVELYFTVYDKDTNKKLFSVDDATIETSKAGNAFEESHIGEEVYNDKGVVISGVKEKEASTFGTDVLLLQISNESGKDLVVYCDSVSVNGKMVNPYILLQKVYNGKKVVCAITVQDSELERNGVESVESVECSIEFESPDTFVTLWNTDNLKF